MSAGTGIRHSECNLESEATRLFQIWTFPNRGGEGPAWGAKPFPKGDPPGNFVALASGLPGDAAARVPGATLKAGETAEIGQYLAPSMSHLPVRRYVHPDTFKMFAPTSTSRCWRRAGLEMKRAEYSRQQTVN